MKFYVEPKEAIKKMKPRAPAVPTSTTNTNSVTRSHTVIPNKLSSQVQKSGAISQTFSAGDISSNNTPDLFKSFDNDPFKETKTAVTSTEGASFADFNSAFGNTGSNGVSSGQMQTSTTVSSSSAISSLQSSTSHKKPAPPPPDRYAALADLDSQFHQQTASEVPVSVPSAIVASTNATVFWSPPNISNAVFVPPTQNPFGNTAPTWSQPIPCVPNPFQPQIPVTNNIVPQQNLNGISNTTKPSLPNGNVANSYWPSASSPAWGAPYQNMQPDPFLLNSAPVVDSYNPWAQSFTSNGANPFANNSAVPGQPSSAPQANSKKNPFL